MVALQSGTGQKVSHSAKHGSSRRGLSQDSNSGSRHNGHIYDTVVKRDKCCSFSSLNTSKSTK